MTPTELTRLIVYVIGAVTGGVLAVLGALNGDPGLVTSGIGLLGVGGLASANVPRSGQADATETV